MAYHIASLFIRDPVPTYSKEFDSENNRVDDTTTLAHFENI